VGLSIPISSFRFWQNPKNPENWWFELYRSSNKGTKNLSVLGIFLCIVPRWRSNIFLHFWHCGQSRRSLHCLRALHLSWCDRSTMAWVRCSEARDTSAALATVPANSICNTHSNRFKVSWPSFNWRGRLPASSDIVDSHSSRPAHMNSLWPMKVYQTCVFDSVTIYVEWNAMMPSSHVQPNVLF